MVIMCASDHLIINNPDSFVNFVFIGGKAMKYIIIWIQYFITVNSELQKFCDHQ